MWIISWLERGDTNGIIIAVVRNNEILITTEGSNWESPSVVRVEFSDVFDVDAQLLWRCPWWFFGCRGEVTTWLVIRLRFRWFHTLSIMDKMPHDVFFWWWNFFISIGICESWPRIVITIFNNLVTSVSHQEACFFTEVPYRGLQTRDTVGN